MSASWFFHSWSELARIALTAVLAYSAIILFLRFFGTRATAKMNNFDWLVTVALGSLLATVILSKDVALLDGLVAILALLSMQFLYSRITQRHQRLLEMMTNPPCLLYFEGAFLEEALRKERIPKDDLIQGIREAGYTRLDDVRAVILENNAEFSVFGWDEADREPELILNMRGFPADVVGRGDGNKGK